MFALDRESGDVVSYRTWWSFLSLEILITDHSAVDRRGVPSLVS